jgi:hypothetical protein
VDAAIRHGKLALQILVIIQEESMKDGTAAVHVQVPVEVASFLLNESALRSPRSNSNSA